MKRMAVVVLVALLLVAPVTGQEVTAGRVAAGRSAAVVSVEGHASQVGLAVLRDGGNAFDAAVAVALALAVTHPQAGNIAGGGFMVAYVADEDRFTTLDFRERAPAAATADMYLGDDGRPVRGLSYVGWRAVGVPGTIAGLAAAHERWGSLPWRRLVEPAVTLARGGYVVDPYLADSFARVAPTFRRYPATAEAFLHADGTPYAAGDVFRQPDLARTLERIADEGADGFYRGPVADRIVEAMRANGGLITAADLQDYRAVEREPIRSGYRGWEVVSMGPPSSGGTVLAEMLNILERFDLGAQEPQGPRTVHLLAEAMRSAYLDRARYLGDSDYVQVPVQRLISDDYAAGLAAAIPLDRARSSAEMGAAILSPPESMETTHLSIVDAAGNAVSMTYTIEAFFGAKVVAPGTGFLLNNEMGDFNEWPGVTDERGTIGTPANLIAPGKRPLSSMTPTILARDGKPAVLLGSPGGKTIINTVLRLVVNIVDFGMSLPDAIDAPRIHHQWMPDVLRLEDGFPAETVDALRALGHEVRTGRVQGDAHCVWIDPGGTRLAVADRRRSGAAAAY